MQAAIRERKNRENSGERFIEHLGKLKVVMVGEVVFSLLVLFDRIYVNQKADFLEECELTQQVVFSKENHVWPLFRTTDLGQNRVELDSCLQTLLLAIPAPKLLHVGFYHEFNSTCLS